MRQTEEDEEDLLTPRGPPADTTFGNDLDWDGGDRVASGIPIPRSSNVNVKRSEDYRSSLRGSIKVDERSALLPRLSEAPTPILSGRQSGSVPTTPDVIGPSLGQSTFCQTVSPPSIFLRKYLTMKPSFSMPPPF